MLIISNLNETYESHKVTEIYIFYPFVDETLLLRKLGLRHSLIFAPPPKSPQGGGAKIAQGGGKKIARASRAG